MDVLESKIDIIGDAITSILDDVDDDHDVNAVESILESLACRFGVTVGPDVDRVRDELDKVTHELNVALHENVFLRDTIKDLKKQIDMLNKLHREAVKTSAHEHTVDALRYSLGRTDNPMLDFEQLAKIKRGLEEEKSKPFDLFEHMKKTVGNDIRKKQLELENDELRRLCDKMDKRVQEANNRALEFESRFHAQTNELCRLRSSMRGL